MPETERKKHLIWNTQTHFEFTFQQPLQANSVSSGDGTHFRATEHLRLVTFRFTTSRPSGPRTPCVKPLRPVQMSYSIKKCQRAAPDGHRRTCPAHCFCFFLAGLMGLISSSSSSASSSSDTSESSTCEAVQDAAFISGLFLSKMADVGLFPTLINI